MSWMNQLKTMDFDEEYDKDEYIDDIYSQVVEED